MSEDIRVISRWGKEPTKDRCISMVKICEGDLHVSIDQGFDGGTSTEILLNPSSAMALADFIDGEYPHKTESLVLDRKTLEVVKIFVNSEIAYRQPPQTQITEAYVDAFNIVVAFIDRELKHLEESK